MLLVSLTYAVASLRMARRGALAQQLNAIESLAAVDVICTDKTGTLTEAALRVVDVAPGPVARARRADRRAGPLRRQHAGAQHHARGDRRGVPVRARAGGPARAVLVAAALERARAGGRDARARCAGALRASGHCAPPPSVTRPRAGACWRWRAARRSSTAAAADAPPPPGLAVTRTRRPRRAAATRHA